ncbi:hypothetical protein HF086_000023 [Spodoptera exigua]|uniref:Cytochrome p450 n=1 Tax=Spodoptera exigua TaxID=7107 RepID=A0A922N056_SPOEX|nr:hypothetical protein HF086_000023 [Spodoptera exigua]
MLWLVLLVVSLGLTYRWFKNRRILQLASQIKCDIKAYPLLGHAYLFIGGGESRMRTFERLGREAIKNGGLTNMWLGDNYFTVVVDPVDLELILKSSLEKDDVMRFARNLIGNGTIFAPVSIWRPRRKVLAPTFSPKNLNSFVRIFSQQSTVLAEQLQKEAGRGPFSLWKYLTSYTMDSVCETALGVNVNAQKTEDEPFLKAFEKCSILIAERMVQPWIYADAVYKLLPYHEAFEKSKSVISSGITLVPGCGVLVHIWGTQRNPRYWGDDAEQFRPERFLEAPLQHPAAFMAFSHGPRNCLGYQYAMMSMKTALATLIRNYRVSIPDVTKNGSRTELKPIRITFDVMMKDADRFTVQLESRRKKEGKFR